MRPFKSAFLGLALCFAAAMPAGGASIGLELQNVGDIIVGDTVSIDVKVTGLFEGLDPADELLAFAFDVDWSAPQIGAFAVESLLAGFDDDSALLGIDVAASAFLGLPNEPRNQDLTLATLSFEALAAGTFGVSILGNPADPDRGLDLGLLFALSDQQIVSASLNGEIQPRTATPLPATLLLIGGGLIGLGGARWNRRRRADPARR